MGPWFNVFAQAVAQRRRRRRVVPKVVDQILDNARS
jgi:hypothetical protein